MTTDARAVVCPRCGATGDLASSPWGSDPNALVQAILEVTREQHKVSVSGTTGDDIFG